MTDQLTLFDTTVTPYGATYAPGPTVAYGQGQHPAVTSPEHDDDLDRRFDAWLRTNPHVLDAFCERALEAKRAGRQRIGAKRLVEVMRWDTRLTTNGDPFKLNNSYTSRLARAAKARHPELDGFFEERELRS